MRDVWTTSSGCHRHRSAAAGYRRMQLAALEQLSEQIDLPHYARKQGGILFWGDPLAFVAIF